MYKELIKNLSIINISTEDFFDPIEVEGKTFNDLIDFIESDNLDSNFMFDVNLEPLLDYFIEGEYTSDQIIKANNKRYGNFIDIFYLKQFNMYFIESGVR